MIARRSFLAGILAASTAPAIARAESLMRVAPVRVIDPFWAGVTPLWVGVDAAGPGDSYTVIVHQDIQAELLRVLRTGEIGRSSRETPLTASDIATMRGGLSREYFDELQRQPVSRSDFLGEFLNREVDLAPRPPRFSADSVVRRLRRW